MTLTKTENIMGNKEQQFFELTQQLGEGIFGEVHIIDMTDDWRKLGGECVYRVYSADGYCITSEKYEDTEGESEEYTTYRYYFASDEFEGFEEISIDNAINMLTYRIEIENNPNYKPIE